MGIISNQIDFPKIKSSYEITINSPSNFNEISLIKQKFIKKFIKKCKKLKINLLICQFQINQILIQKLQENKINSISYIPKIELEKLSISSKGKICGNFDEIDENSIGYFEQVDQIFLPFSSFPILFFHSILPDYFDRNSSFDDHQNGNYNLNNNNENNINNINLNNNKEENNNNYNNNNKNNNNNNNNEENNLNNLQEEKEEKKQVEEIEEEEEEEREVEIKEEINQVEEIDQVSILIRGGNKMYCEEVIRAMEDCIRVIKEVIKDARYVTGGASFEGHLFFVLFSNFIPLFSSSHFLQFVFFIFIFLIVFFNFKIELFFLYFY